MAVILTAWLETDATQAEERIWVSAKINGKDANLVFDTGADANCLFSEGASRLGLVVRG